MISKIFLTGKTFAQTCEYVCQDIDRAQILDVKGVRDYDYRLMAEDFALQHRFLPEKEKPVFHGMLSFYPGEDPGDRKMIRIARAYLREIRMDGTQYAIVKHTDKAHLHLHIIANRVNNDAIIIGEGLIIERGIKAAQKLTREYKLTIERGKNLSLTHLEALHKVDAKRYRLYQAIQRHLPACRRLEDLEKRLLEEGITVRYRRNPVNGEREGISFRIENIAFAGHKVDPGCSLANLKRTLLQQIRQTLQDEAVRAKQGLPLRPELEMKKELGVRPALEVERKLVMRPESEKGADAAKEKGAAEELEVKKEKELEVKPEDQRQRIRHSHGLRL